MSKKLPSYIYCRLNRSKFYIMTKMRKTSTSKLTHIAQILCGDETDYALLRQTLQDYRSLLTDLTDLDPAAPSAKQDVALSTGKAIGTSWAALCIDDLMRTKRFVKGLYLAVQTLLDQRQKRPVEILYAGTGPFATLALPLTALFSPHEMRITALEINPASCTHLAQLIDKLNLQDYFRSIENVDATAYTVANEQTIDILLSETMQRGLEKEPQVAIIHHLLPQLQEEVILIPQTIQLHLGFMAASTLHPTQQPYHRVAQVFELSKDTVQRHRIAQTEPGPLTFPQKQIALAPSPPQSHSHWVILTDIQVFGPERLGPNESGITLPIPLPNLPWEEDQQLELTAQYEVGADPGLRIAEYSVED